MLTADRLPVSGRFAVIPILAAGILCCGGLEHAVKTALKDSGKLIPWSVAVISTDGKVISEL